MGLKDDLKKAGDRIKEAGGHLKDAGEKIGDKVKDRASEAAHRVAAEGEKKKREIFGDNLTENEKAKSLLQEAKNNFQAKIDSAKGKIDDLK
ncbi:MAG TPA: hypothetical protein VGZ00_07065 [Candidatus Baltobacteraceae bacterium]|jgi:hypothetical protein|nr:hypothetical protein [Candidatus Baltobacteraceae bacterium]